MIYKHTIFIQSVHFKTVNMERKQYHSISRSLCVGVKKSRGEIKIKIGYVNKIKQACPMSNRCVALDINEFTNLLRLSEKIKQEYWIEASRINEDKKKSSLSQIPSFNYIDDTTRGPCYCQRKMDHASTLQQEQVIDPRTV